MSRDVRDQEAPGEGLPRGIDAAPYGEVSVPPTGAPTSELPAPLPAPDGLQGPGLALWDRVTSLWELRPDEENLLSLLSYATSEADALRRAIEADGLVVKGSRGQPRQHPLLASLSTLRLTVLRLSAQLALPDADEDQGRSPAQRKASHAAQTRWGPGYVKTADFRRQDA